MNDKNETKILSVIDALLQENGMGGLRRGSGLTVTPLSGDGSSRRFYRIRDGEKRLCLAVAPPDNTAPGLAEAKAARSIGLHLLGLGISVPEQYGWDEEHGVLLFEDLGDEKLHDRVVVSKSGDSWVEQVRPLYAVSVENLAEMQVHGAEGFDPEWCWDSPAYDRKLMLEKESAYFLRAFWENYLGREEPAGLQEEFEQIADLAALIPAHYFLHRDFQSRNIMLRGDAPCFIDFQGGRLGPLAYDLASLLIDPYVALPFDFQEELLDHYLDRVESLVAVDRKSFVEEYLLLALQRNLQIVGAFAHLTRECNKTFFEQFLPMALVSLNSIVECELFAEMRVLRKTVATAVQSG